MNSVYLERRDPAKNMSRFYRIILTRTLFGEWAVIREWGRIGSPGTVRELWFETEESARDERDRLRRAKERRGYFSPGSGENGGVPY